MTPKDAASILPRKDVDGEFQSVDDNGSFVMYALVFGNVDRQGDLIEQGAVTNCDELVKDGWAALNHDQADYPKGYFETAEQDEHGLKLTGKFHSDADSQKLRTIIKERLDAGKSVKTSIGYLVPVDGERYEKRDGRTVRVISKLSVYEASFVNLPANPEAEVVSAKSLTDFTLDGFEEEDELMAAEQGLVESLRKALGIATKGGRKMSGATLEKMKGYCKAMDEHAEKCMGHAKEMNEKCKSLKATGESYKATAEEFSKCLKDFEGGKIKEDDEGDEEIDDAESGDKADSEMEDGMPDKGKKRTKIDEGEGDDEDSEEPKKEETEEEKALVAFRKSLSIRSLAGRRDAVCP